MDTAAEFLGTSILFSLGIVVMVIGATVVNNIIHKYWKPITIFKWLESTPTRFATAEEVKKLDEKQTS